jgi:hypothetical protein
MGRDRGSTFVHRIVEEGLIAHWAVPPRAAPPAWGRYVLLTVLVIGAVTFAAAIHPFALGIVALGLLAGTRGARSVVVALTRRELRLEGPRTARIRLVHLASVVADDAAGELVFRLSDPREHGYVLAVPYAPDDAREVHWLAGEVTRAAAFAVDVEGEGRREVPASLRRATRQG